MSVFGSPVHRSDRNMTHAKQPFRPVSPSVGYRINKSQTAGVSMKGRRKHLIDEPNRIGQNNISTLSRPKSASSVRPTSKGYQMDNEFGARHSSPSYLRPTSASSLYFGSAPHNVTSNMDSSGIGRGISPSPSVRSLKSASRPLSPSVTVRKLHRRYHSPAGSGSSNPKTNKGGFNSSDSNSVLNSTRSRPISPATSVRSVGSINNSNSYSTRRPYSATHGRDYSMEFDYFDQKLHHLQAKGGCMGMNSYNANCGINDSHMASFSPTANQYNSQSKATNNNPDQAAYRHVLNLLETVVEKAKSCISVPEYDNDNGSNSEVGELVTIPDNPALQHNINTLILQYGNPFIESTIMGYTKEYKEAISRDYLMLMSDILEEYTSTVNATSTLRKTNEVLTAYRNELREKKGVPLEIDVSNEELSMGSSPVLTQTQQYYRQSQFNGEEDGKLSTPPPPVSMPMVEEMAHTHADMFPVPSSGNRHYNVREHGDTHDSNKFPVHQQLRTAIRDNKQQIASEKQHKKLQNSELLSTTSHGTETHTRTHTKRDIIAAKSPLFHSHSMSHSKSRLNLHVPSCVDNRNTNTNLTIGNDACKSNGASVLSSIIQTAVSTPRSRSGTPGRFGGAATSRAAGNVAVHTVPDGSGKCNDIVNMDAVPIVMQPHVPSNIDGENTNANANRIAPNRQNSMETVVSESAMVPSVSNAESSSSSADAPLSVSAAFDGREEDGSSFSKSSMDFTSFDDAVAILSGKKRAQSGSHSGPNPPNLGGSNEYHLSNQSISQDEPSAVEMAPDLPPTPPPPPPPLEDSTGMFIPCVQPGAVADGAGVDATLAVTTGLVSPSACDIPSTEVKCEANVENQAVHCVSPSQSHTNIQRSIDSGGTSNMGLFELAESHMHDESVFEVSLSLPKGSETEAQSEPARMKNDYESDVPSTTMGSLSALPVPTVPVVRRRRCPPSRPPPPPLPQTPVQTPATAPKAPSMSLETVSVDSPSAYKKTESGTSHFAASYPDVLPSSWNQTDGEDSNAIGVPPRNRCKAHQIVHIPNSLTNPGIKTGSGKTENRDIQSLEALPSRPMNVTSVSSKMYQLVESLNEYNQSGGLRGKKLSSSSIYRGILPGKIIVNTCGPVDKMTTEGTTDATAALTPDADEVIPASSVNMGEATLSTCELLSNEEPICADPQPVKAKNETALCQESKLIPQCTSNVDDEITSTSPILAEENIIVPSNEIVSAQISHDFETECEAERPYIPETVTTHNIIPFDMRVNSQTNRGVFVTDWTDIPEYELEELEALGKSANGRQESVAVETYTDIDAMANSHPEVLTESSNKTIGMNSGYPSEMLINHESGQLDETGELEAMWKLYTSIVQDAQGFEPENQVDTEPDPIVEVEQERKTEVEQVEVAVDPVSIEIELGPVVEPEVVEKDDLLVGDGMEAKVVEEPDFSIHNKEFETNASIEADMHEDVESVVVEGATVSVPEPEAMEDTPAPLPLVVDCHLTDSHQDQLTSPVVEVLSEADINSMLAKINNTLALAKSKSEATMMLSQETLSPSKPNNPNSSLKIDSDSISCPNKMNSVLSEQETTSLTPHSPSNSRTDSTDSDLHDCKPSPGKSNKNTTVAVVKKNDKVDWNAIRKKRNMYQHHNQQHSTDTGASKGSSSTNTLSNNTDDNTKSLSRKPSDLFPSYSSKGKISNTAHKHDKTKGMKQDTNSNVYSHTVTDGGATVNGSEYSTLMKLSH